MVPISLYVSMRLARVAQKYFMDRDAQAVYVEPPAVSPPPPPAAAAAAASEPAAPAVAAAAVAEDAAATAAPSATTTTTTARAPVRTPRPVGTDGGGGRGGDSGGEGVTPAPTAAPSKAPATAAAQATAAPAPAPAPSGGVYRLQVRQMDLNDELGQVSHLFTDKTGTLTSNYMEFRKFICRGVTYGLGTTEIGLARRRRAGVDTSGLEAHAARAAALAVEGRTPPHVLFLDGVEGEPGRCLLGPDGDLHGTGAAADPAQAAALHLFLLQLAANHTVIRERVHDPASGAVVGSQLSASSPDEEAFVLAAASFGYAFVDRVRDVIQLDVRGAPARYRVVAVLPYSQHRKMMSVVVEDVAASASGDEARAFLLLAKGADSKILTKLARRRQRQEGKQEESGDVSSPSGAAPVHVVVDDANDDGDVAAAVEGMAEMARDGLRTLAFGYRYLPPDELDGWLDEFADAMADLGEKAKKAAGLANAIDGLMDRLETGLTLQGATANEDKLQEGVPETVALLAAAGIKMYVLTGDKVETAINIAYAARLLSPEYEVAVLTSEELGGRVADELPALLAARAGDIRDAAAAGREPSAPLALVVDEAVLDVALAGRDSRRNLLTVAEACRTVVCARCRPDQKKRVVELVKRGLPRSRTLAVGDGANDVDMVRGGGGVWGCCDFTARRRMRQHERSSTACPSPPPPPSPSRMQIQAAHVGVGIAGKEGMQAANASDYAIGRFRFLQRLLLVHGRANYLRLSLLISYSFYKNLQWSFASWLFSIYNGWSGQRVYMEAYSQTYNLLFTGLPILVVAVLDRDISPGAAVRFPFVYTDGLLRRALNARVLALWLGSALWEGAVLFFFLRFAADAASYAGTTPFVYELGVYLITASLLTVTLRLVMVTHRHDWVFGLSVAGSLLLVVACAWLFDALNFDRMRGGMRYVYGSPAFWLYLLLVAAVTQIPFGLYTLLRRQAAPRYADLVEEYQVLVAPSGSGSGSYGTPRRSAYQRLCTCGMRRQRVSALPTGDQLLAELLGRGPPSNRERPVRTAVNLRPEEVYGVVNALPDVAPAAPPAAPPSATSAVDAGAGGGGDSHHGGAPSVTAEADSAATTARWLRCRRRRRRARSGSATAAAAAIPADPVVAALVLPTNPRASWRHRPDVNTLPLAGDVEADLTEWPYEQRILRSLRALAATGAPADAVFARRAALVKARLIAAVERGQIRAVAAAAGAPVPPGAEAAAAGEAAPAEAPPPPPPPYEVRLVVGRGEQRVGLATAAAMALPPQPPALPPAAAVAPAPVLAAPPAAVAALPAAPPAVIAPPARRRRAVTVVPAVAPAPAAPAAAAAVAVARPPPPLHRRVGSDFSIDTGHTALLGQLQSTLGLWQSAAAVASAGGAPPGRPGSADAATAQRRRHAALSQPAVLPSQHPLTVVAGAATTTGGAAPPLPVPRLPPVSSLEDVAAVARTLATPPPSPTPGPQPPHAASRRPSAGAAVGSSRRRHVSDAPAPAPPRNVAMQPPPAGTGLETAHHRSRGRQLQPLAPVPDSEAAVGEGQQREQSVLPGSAGRGRSGSGSSGSDDTLG
jgi:magnesium-transporting ATPase (P-type)